jgi:flagellar export protein FliJ
MKKFEFRLQRVLDYRAMLVEWAKQAYLEAQARRIESENELTKIFRQREVILAVPANTLVDRRVIEACLIRLDEKERQQLTVVNDLSLDEGRCLREWLDKRQDLEALQKLREREFAVWTKAANRAEQKALDEWTSQRRAA